MIRAHNLNRTLGNGALWAILCWLTLCGSPCLAAPQSLPPDHPTYQAVRKVYVAVARMFGDGRQPPLLVVSPRGSGTGDIARQSRGSDGLVGTGTRHDEGYIALNERVYDLLAAGKPSEARNGLAFVLGHELAHYYLRHGWVGSFGNAFTGSKVGRELSQVLPPDQVTPFEVQADYLGGLYSFLAGYDSLEAAPRTLDRLYAGFRLPATGGPRPTLAQRKEIVALARSQLHRLIPAFDSATVLMLLGRYDDAARLYDYLATAAPSREFSGNAGVARILEALRLFGRDEMPFALPLELDAATRLKEGRSKSLTFQPDPVARRRALLEQAAENLEQAVTLSPGYATARVNLACALALLGRSDEAQEQATAALRLARTERNGADEAAALIMGGIIRAKRGETGAARDDFTAARSGNRRLAELNLALLTGTPPTPPAAGRPGAPAETVAGVTPEALLRPGRTPGDEFVLKGFDRSRLAVRAFGRDNHSWSGLIIEPGDGRTITMLRTGPAYDGRTGRGIGKGAATDDLRRVYGEPTRVVTARQGRYEVYDHSRVIFEIGADDTVSGWLVYRERE